MDDKQVAHELVKVAKELTAFDDVMKVADVFARFLIGDRDVAVSQLKALKNVDIAPESTDPNVYDTQYRKLVMALRKAIRDNV
jgi:hypothetical protein